MDEVVYRIMAQKTPLATQCCAREGGYKSGFVSLEPRYLGALVEVECSAFSSAQPLSSCFGG